MLVTGPVDSALVSMSEGGDSSPRVEIAPSLVARDELLKRVVKYFRNDATADDDNAAGATKRPLHLTKNINVIRACTALAYPFAVVLLALFDLCFHKEPDVKT